MSRVAFIFRTDVHCADKSPDSWKGDYPEEIAASLEQIGRLAAEHEVTAVLDGGDFFHIKTPSKSSHGLVARMSRIHAKYPCPTYSIEGNHDLTYNNLDTVERQPLGVLYDTEVFRQLREEVFESDGYRVRVVGVPYIPDQKLDVFRALRKQPGDTHLIAIVHALAGKNPPAHVQDFFGEPVFRYSDLIHEGGPDLYAFGHWHRDQGIEIIDGRTFVNQGAVSRGALSQENLDRIPQVTLIECSPAGVSARAIPLSVAPASEVFNLELKVRRDRETEVIAQFVERIEDDLKPDPSATVDVNIDALTFAPEIQSLARYYLAMAREGR